MANKLTDNLEILGDLILTGAIYGSATGLTAANLASNAAIARTQLAQNTLQRFQVKLTDFRVWDAFQTVLPGTSAADDLGLYGGTFGTNSPQIKTYDVKAAGAVTLRARALVHLPIEYDAAETVLIRLHAGMETTVADTTATIDVECYESNREGGISADLCTTSATTINSLTLADKDFTITATSLNPGDILDIRITVAVNDAATATAVIAKFGSCELLADVRG